MSELALELCHAIWDHWRVELTLQAGHSVLQRKVNPPAEKSSGGVAVCPLQVHIWSPLSKPSGARLW